MSEDFVRQILTLYGPLGLGWIVAAFLWIDNRRLVNRLLDNADAMKLMAGIIRPRSPQGPAE